MILLSVPVICVSRGRDSSKEITHLMTPVDVLITSTLPTPPGRVIWLSLIMTMILSCKFLKLVYHLLRYCNCCMSNHPDILPAVLSLELTRRYYSFNILSLIETSLGRKKKYIYIYIY